MAGDGREEKRAPDLSEAIQAFLRAKIVEGTPHETALKMLTETLVKHAKGLEE
jgi:hypothetical protein